MNLASNKKIVWILFWGFIIFAIFSVAGWFLYQKIIQTSALIAAAESKITTLEKEEQEFSSASSGLKDLDKEISLIDSAFISEKTFVNFIELAEKMARKAGVEFSADTALLPSTPKEHAVLTFDIKGGFSDTTHFLALLDRIPYSGIVDNMNILKSASLGTNKTPVLTTKIHYVIFNFTQNQ